MPDSGKRTRIYDVGAGSRLAGAVVLTGMVVAAVGLVAPNLKEIRDLPRYALANPVAGVVILAGGVLTVWALGFGIWIPFRVLFLPEGTTGTLVEFRVVDDVKGRKCIDIILASARISTPYNEVLERSLRPVSPGTTLQISSVRGMVSRIEAL